MKSMKIDAKSIIKAIPEGPLRANYTFRLNIELAVAFKEACRKHGDLSQGLVLEKLIEAFLADLKRNS